MATLDLVSAGETNWATRQNANLTALNTELIATTAKANAAQVAADLDDDTAALAADSASALGTQLNAAIAEGAALSTALPYGHIALEFPTHLDRWRARREDSRWGLRNIAVSGHSVPLGYYANNAYSDNFPVFRERGVIGQLRRLIGERYGHVSYPGEAAWLLYADERVALSGGNSTTKVGPAKSGRTLSSDSHTITWTGVYGRYFRIPFWLNNNTTDDASTVTVTIDGGSPVAITGQPTGSDLFWMSQVFDAGSSGSHSIVITGPTNAKNATSIGLMVYDVNPTTATGIAVHRWGDGGGRMADQFYLSGSNQPRTLYSTLRLLPVDLHIQWFIANEASTVGQGLGQTPSSLASLAASVAEYQTDTNGGTTLIVAGPRRDLADVGPTYTEQEFVDALRAVAEANPHVAFLDVTRVPVWADFATADAAGMMQDGVHPNRLGHSMLSSILYDAIMG